MRMANFTVLKSMHEYILLQDLGPWDQFPTITNSAEEVVEEMDKRLNRPDFNDWINADGKQRRLYYIDSENNITELLVKDGKFAGFKSADCAWPIGAKS